jgi:glucose-1-phosphate cytidylyltransferase
MKAVILAGGLGTRISEETVLKPKPMIEIGGRPILWHIMKIYSNHGINDFIICCGYKGYLIKEYFANYSLHQSDVTFDFMNNRRDIHNERSEPWRVTLVDTGEFAQTGGRLLAIKHYLEEEDCFCMTYGDGLSDINISASIDFHRSHGKLATVTAVFPPARFGALEITNSQVQSFMEKPKGDGSMISGGFFVLSPKALRGIEGADSVWEREPINQLAKEGDLMAFEHSGFWQPMDTLRDKIFLEDLWVQNKAPWKVW